MISRVPQFSLVMGVTQKVDKEVEYERAYIESTEKGSFSIGKFLRLDSDSYKS